MGAYAIGRAGTVLRALGLGSCVAVVLSDREAGVGALIHIPLPSPSLSRNRDNPIRSPDTALPIVLAELERAGAERGRLTARLIGGAAMFGDLNVAGAVPMGERNVVACRSALRDAGVPVVAEVVGGSRGRSVWFDVGADAVTVRLVGREPETV